MPIACCYAKDTRGGGRVFRSRGFVVSAHPGRLLDASGHWSTHWEKEGPSGRGGEGIGKCKGGFSKERQCGSEGRKNDPSIRKFFKEHVI